jgi:CspA family cold shock protein
MAKGRVKWFNDLKGYGFITMLDNNNDIYVHHTEIQGHGYRTLRVGEEVECEVNDTPEGLKASNVILVK